jgi:arabinogalactan endo-1,4-beta-galactosidase
MDYDCIGLSFYPAWGDSLDALKQNMAELIRTQDKDVFVAETSYPWHDASQLGGGGTMNWPCTPAGQKQFLSDLIAVLRAAPGGHGLGFAWWYPEARPTPGLRIWRDGAEGLFDRNGVPLPAMDLFGEGR